jgi:Flp pilus assembly pilin Flp
MRSRSRSCVRRRRCRDERGTTTAEYAIGTLAACAFAAVLYKILTGGQVASALGGLVHRALEVAG